MISIREWFKKIDLKSKILVLLSDITLQYLKFQALMLIPIMEWLLTARGIDFSENRKDKSKLAELKTLQEKLIWYFNHPYEHDITAAGKVSTNVDINALTKSEDEELRKAVVGLENLMTELNIELKYNSSSGTILKTTKTSFKPQEMTPQETIDKITNDLREKNRPKSKMIAQEVITAISESRSANDTAFIADTMRRDDAHAFEQLDSGEIEVEWLPEDFVSTKLKPKTTTRTKVVSKVVKISKPKKATLKKRKQPATKSAAKKSKGKTR